MSAPGAFLPAAGWVLLGTTLGAAASLALGHRILLAPPVDVASLASLMVFALLAASLCESQIPSPVRR